MGVYWRQAAAYTYLLICLMDFVFMPVYFEWHNARMNNADLITLATRFQDGPSQIAALQTLREQRAWKPITLDSAGWVHVSFGAILGVSAFTRKRREEEEDEDDHE